MRWRLVAAAIAAAAPAVAAGCQPRLPERKVRLDLAAQPIEAAGALVEDDPAELVPPGPPPEGAGAPAAPGTEPAPAGPLPSSVSATAGGAEAGASIYEREARATAYRFLDGLFHHSRRRALREVALGAVYDNWDLRDGRRPNPLLIDRALFAALDRVRIEGAARWRDMSQAERLAAIEVRIAGMRALATYTGVRGGVALPLVRFRGRWLVHKLPYRADERPGKRP
jgi:hypothetical protein